MKTWQKIGIAVVVLAASVSLFLRILGINAVGLALQSNVALGSVFRSCDTCIYPDAGIGKVRIGDDYSFVIKTLGEPSVDQTDEESRVLIYSKLGLLIALSPLNSLNSKVQYLTIFSEGVHRIGNFEYAFERPESSFVLAGKDPIDFTKDELEELLGKLINPAEIEGQYNYRYFGLNIGWSADNKIERVTVFDATE